jgi:DMSO reductase anchor subunit
MRPAWSVILLTTLIGTSQGLFLALYAADLLASTGALDLPPVLIAAGVAVVLALAAAGLAASFLHLGHPERAWRSAAQWRTSWLSREVIALPGFMALVAAYGLAGWLRMPWVALGLGALAAVASLTLYVCTGMIYACLRFLQEWHTPLTVVNYLALGCASGLSAAAALSAWLAPQLARPYALGAVAVTAVALATRAASLRRNRRLRQRSTLQTATGMKHPRVVQTAQGAMGGSFNTREFFHGARPGNLRAVKRGFIGAAFLVPMLLLAGVAWGAGAELALAAFVIQYGGLLAERWYFFAEARHPQNLYYQAIS